MCFCSLAFKNLVIVENYIAFELSKFLLFSAFFMKKKEHKKGNGESCGAHLFKTIRGVFYWIFIISCDYSSLHNTLYIRRIFPDAVFSHFFICKKFFQRRKKMLLIGVNSGLKTFSTSKAISLIYSVGFFFFKVNIF